MNDIYELFKWKIKLESLQNKKLLIWGDDEESKRLFRFLINHGYRLGGFVLNDKDEINDKKYLNVHFYGERILSDDNFIVIDRFGDSPIINKVSLFVNNNIDTFISNEIYIYGAGEAGILTNEFLMKAGIVANGFIDSNINKQGEKISGLKVFNPAVLEGEGEFIVIVAVTDTKQRKKIIEDIGNKCVTYVSGLMEIKYLWEEFCVSDNDEWEIVGNEGTLIYALYQQNVASKKIILTGNRCSLLRAAKRIWSLFDVDISYMTCIKSCEQSDIRDFYSILYEKDEYICFFVGNSDEREELASLIYECNIKPETMAMAAGTHACVTDMHSLDPNLGFNIPSYTKLNTEKSNDSRVKIAILGGSTTTLNLYTEKIWPEYLTEILSTHNISAQVYCTSVAGQTVSQEVIKLLRDVLVQYNPDIVISYSLINETGFCFVDKHPFIHNYQFELMSKFYDQDKISNINMGIENNDYSTHWITMQRVMHAICEEFNINYISIVQPYLIAKNKKGFYEEMIMQYKMEQWKIEKYKKLYDATLKKISMYDWMHDFTSVFENYECDAFFDICHTYGAANRFLAKKIYAIIEKSKFF